jgi:pimeloyl-ACP methyl ester carboxylesterase
MSTMLDASSGRYITANGLNFYVRDHGTGEPVFLLHGFPDTGDLWRYQVPVLVDHGYRTVVPDLRGRGLSAKPPHVQDYALPFLVQDVAAIMNELEIERAHIVGHDWGAVVSWAFAAMFPSRVRTLTALSVGAPGIGELPTLESLQKAWYRILFVFPGNVAERIVSQNDWYILRELTRSSPDSERYIEDLRDPTALTAGLNWYRANLPIETLVSPLTHSFSIHAPTLGVWSSEDVALTEEAMKNSQRVVKGSWRYERIENCGHWIPLEKSEHFNRILIEFLHKESSVSTN